MRTRSLLFLLTAATVVGGAPLTLGGLVPLPGVDAKLSTAKPAVLTVKKTGDERRLVAIELKPAEAAGAKALLLRGTLSGKVGTARVAVLAWSGDNCWFRTGGVLTVGPEAEVGVALNDLKPTAFSADAEAKVDWAKLDRLWLGIAFDGPADAVLTLVAVNASTELPRPTAALTVSLAEAAKWPVTKEPAVQSKVALTNEGPDGAPALRIDLTYPEARHLWSMLSGPVKGEDLGTYRALRIRYKAVLPKGPNLLFSLTEAGGGQYLIEPPPAQGDAWRTLEVPLADLKLGSWTKDDNGHLDMDAGVNLQLGCHGTANPPGSGTLWIAEASLVP